jgi:hypothetical protein
MTVLLLFLAFRAGHAPGQNVAGEVIAAVDSMAVPGAMVFLHRITATAGEVIDSTRSDADGRFSFELPAGDSPETLFAAAAVRDDVSYFGPVLHAGMDAPRPYRIVTHVTELISEPVRGNPILLRHVVISPTAHGLVQVAEVVDVAGAPDRAVRMADETIPVWSLALPKGAQSWAAMEGGLAPDAISFVDGRVEARATLPPSGMRLSFGYFTEGPTIEFPVEHSTERFDAILVGVEEKKIEGLRAGDSSDLPPGGQAKRFVASGVAPGETIGLTLASEQVAWGPVLTWGLLGLALTAAAGVSAVAAKRDRA